MSDKSAIRILYSLMKTAPLTAKLWVCENGEYHHLKEGGSMLDIIKGFEYRAANRCVLFDDCEKKHQVQDIDYEADKGVIFFL